MGKDIKKLQVSICCVTKKRFEKHAKATELCGAALVKFILSEYYSKVNTAYNNEV